MGGNFTNVNGNANNVNIESDIRGNLYDQVRDKHGEFIAAALKDLERLIQRERNSSAAANFTSMTQAIAQGDTRPEIARGYWERIATAIPAVLNSAAAVALLNSVLR